MKNSVAVLNVVLSLIFVSVTIAQQEQLIIENIDSKDNRAEYLIISPDDFAENFVKLAGFRQEQGLSSRIIKLSTVSNKFGDAKASPDAIKKFIVFALQNWRKPAIKFLLLGGDITLLPAFKINSSYTKFLSEPNIITDYPYSYIEKPEEPVICVGRMPARNKDELEIMITKTINYEKNIKPERWRKRLLFIAGEAGFSPVLDSMIETTFANVISEDIPADLDLRLIYAKASSEYCWFPPKIPDKIAELINDGALFVIYLGHGTRDGFAEMKWKNRYYPVFSKEHIKMLKAEKCHPVILSFACSTSEMDAKEESFGEEIIRAKEGPVAYLGGTRVTQSYTNTVLPLELLPSVFEEKLTRIGEIILSAKKRALSESESKFRKQADFMAGTIQGKENLKNILNDGVHHYILFGDPALRIAIPDERIEIQAPSTAKLGEEISISAKTAKIKDADVEITLECWRTKFKRPLPKVKESDPDFEEKIKQRFEIANNKVIKVTKAKMSDGKFETKLTIPADIKKGKYILKCYIWDKQKIATGSCFIKIK